MIVVVYYTARNVLPMSYVLMLFIEYRVRCFSLVFGFRTPDGLCARTIIFFYKIVFIISRHGQPESHHTRERRQRRASVLHQPAAADASRGAVERAAEHADIHPSGTRSGHRSQYTLLHRQGQKYVFDRTTTVTTVFIK